MKISAKYIRFNRFLIPITIFCLGLLAFVPANFADTLSFPTLLDPAKGIVHNRKLALAQEDGRTVASMGKAEGTGIAWFKNLQFTNGVIECELRQDHEPADLNFVGIAFNGVDGSTYEAIYFRPNNFSHADSARRARAVQYVSVPGNDWYDLREKSPGAFEKAAVPAPKQDDWFHCRIEADEKGVRVFINKSQAPCLTVKRLTARHGGWVGLWVGNQSGGRFANLSVIQK